MTAVRSQILELITRIHQNKDAALTRSIPLDGPAIPEKPKKQLLRLLNDHAKMSQLSLSVMQYFADLGDFILRSIHGSVCCELVTLIFQWMVNSHGVQKKGFFTSYRMGRLYRYTC